MSYIFEVGKGVWSGSITAAIGFNSDQKVRHVFVCMSTKKA